MDTPEIPKTGGSYVRKTDGSLQLVATTKPAPTADELAKEETTEPAEPAGPAAETEES